jgi:protein SCO1/2
VRLRGALAALGLLVACGLPANETYRVEGSVRSVDPSARQVTLAHDEIPGFMPAMTMNFDVAPAVSLDALRPGARVRFELERTGSTLRILTLEPTGALDVAAGAAGSAGAATPGELDAAPDFALIDQDGRRFALKDQAGRAVLLDFIFTRCVGPCPILTSRHVELQRRLPRELQGRTRFVSVSLDPAHDRPEMLRSYARQRGVDLANWSLLTGEDEAVDGVLRAYGVGSVRLDERTIEHLVVTFLIDPEQRIAQRYLGLEHPTEQMLADLEQVLD